MATYLQKALAAQSDLAPETVAAGARPMAAPRPQCGDRTPRGPADQGSGSTAGTSPLTVASHESAVASVAARAPPSGKVVPQAVRSVAPPAAPHARPAMRPVDVAAAALAARGFAVSLPGGQRPLHRPMPISKEREPRPRTPPVERDRCKLFVGGLPSDGASPNRARLLV